MESLTIILINFLITLLNKRNVFMATFYSKEVVRGKGSREVLFQNMGGSWYAFIIEDKNREPLYIRLPGGITPESKNFCFISLFDDGSSGTYNKSA
jgi:predicted DNA-binding ArsR family transcriptional regulator